MMTSDGGSLTELDACQFVAEENPVCAPCAPNPIPPPAPTPYTPYKLDVASYSNAPASGDRSRRRRGGETGAPAQTYLCGTM